MHHNSILYKEPTRCNFGSIVFSHCKITLRVSDAFCVHHPDPRHAPVAATTVFSTPDDGRRKRPKRVE